jgi:hypothetical protein
MNSPDTPVSLESPDIHVQRQRAFETEAKQQQIRSKQCTSEQPPMPFSRLVSSFPGRVDSVAQLTVVRSHDSAAQRNRTKKPEMRLAIVTLFSDSGWRCETAAPLKVFKHAARLGPHPARGEMPRLCRYNGRARECYPTRRKLAPQTAASSALVAAAGAAARPLRLRRRDSNLPLPHPECLPPLPHQAGPPLTDGSGFAPPQLVA